MVRHERCRSCLGPVVRYSKFKPPTVETVQYCLQAVITVASTVRFAYAAIKIMPGPGRVFRQVLPLETMLTTVVYNYKAYINSIKFTVVERQLVTLTFLQ